MSTSPVADAAQAPVTGSINEGLPQRDGGLSEHELFWREHNSWFQEHGYILRLRYSPDWTPSWKGKNINRFNCEDGHLGPGARHLMDARRVSDGEIVMFKKVIHTSTNPSKELEMGLQLSSEPYASDPRNHCVPVYETLRIPDRDEQSLMVIPFLSPWYVDEPPFRTIGEVVEFCRQVLECLQFLHSHRIAHNDIKFDNIMMDSRPLYDQPMHPVYSLRSYDWKIKAHPKSFTLRPVKYYFIDFGLCRQYDSSSSPQEYPQYGGDLSVPEFKSRPKEPCDPFAVDVYRLGNVIREKFVGGGPHGQLNPCFSFMHELISDMTQDDSSKRPTIDQVVSRFESTAKRLSWIKLRSRVTRPDKTVLERMIHAPIHWARQVTYMVTRVPAIPRA